MDKILELNCRNKNNPLVFTSKVFHPNKIQSSGTKKFFLVKVGMFKGVTYFNFHHILLIMVHLP